MTSNIHKLMSLSFWCGWIASHGLLIFLRGWHGIRLQWWDLHWVWGVAIFAVAFLYYYNKRVAVAFWLKVDAKEGEHDESDTL